MYLPKHFAQKDTALLQDFIQEYPFGTLATAIDGIPQMNHLPFYLDREQQCLQAHIPRINPLFKQFQDLAASQLASPDDQPTTPFELPVLVAFLGPNAYITPSWYPSKKEHGKVVPTWNYAVVHVKGRLRLQRDTDWLRRHLTHLTNQQEPTRASTWQMSDAPEEYTASMMSVLCGLEIAIDELVGKYKVSQNREARDQHGVQEHLSNSDDAQDRALAQLQQQINDGDAAPSPRAE